MAGKYLQPIFRFDESGIAHAVTVILLGIGGSLLLAKALDQMQITWIFGRPRLLRRALLMTNDVSWQNIPNF